MEILSKIPSYSYKHFRLYDIYTLFKMHILSYLLK